MIELLSSLLDFFKETDGLKLILIALISIACFAVYRMAGMLQVVFNIIAKKMSTWTQDLDSKMVENIERLEKWSHGFNSSVFRLNTSMEKTNRELESLRQELIKEIKELKSANAEIEKSLSDVIVIKGDLVNLKGRIQVVEKQTGESASIEDLTKLYSIVKEHNRIITNIKKK